MRMEVRAEKAKLWIARSMPRWLAYWCAIRVIAHATTGEFSSTVTPELTALDALKRWERG